MAGRPAFSTASEFNGDNIHGLTVREYFAAAALQGILANEGLRAVVVADSPNADAVEQLAFEYADGMLRAGAK